MIVIFKQIDNSIEKSVDILPTSKLGVSREAVQMLLELPGNIPYRLVLERTGKLLDDNWTFEEAGVQENDKLLLLIPSEPTQNPAHRKLYLEKKFFHSLSNSPKLSKSKPLFSKNYLLIPIAISFLGIFISSTLLLIRVNVPLHRVKESALSTLSSSKASPLEATSIHKDQPTPTINKESNTEISEETKSENKIIAPLAEDSISLDEETSITLIISLYDSLSAQNWEEASVYFSPGLSSQFDSSFFQQFERVTVSNLRVVSRTNSIINFLGENTYVWPDGTI